MELEEAIKRLKDLIEDNKQYFEKTLNKDDTDIQERLKKDNEAIETVLKELDVLKFKYQARKDRTDTIIKKKDKMIDKMADEILELNTMIVEKGEFFSIVPMWLGKEHIIEYFKGITNKKD